MEGDPLEIIGDLIDGQFRVDAFVGIGDLSAVYRGFHVGVEAEVAIKFLEVPTTLDAALVEPLIRSFREGSKLHYRLARGHMNIAQSIASGQTLAPRTGVQVPYLVREWLEGASLSHDFADRRTRGLRGRSVVETRDLFAGAIEGLAYAHRQGVAHLGLNPTNLFVARTESETRLKILDFGVAHAMNEHGAPARAQKPGSHATGLRILSPAYAAPEQLDAAIGRPGPATDVYAIALMWIEAMDDAPVFNDAPPPLERALQPEARAVAIPRSLDPRVATVIERALAFVPRDRYPSAGIFWKELSEVLPQQGAPLVRRPSGPLKIPARPRSQTLLGLNVAGPDVPASVPPAPAAQAPKRPSAHPPKRPSAPPLPLAASRAPKPPPPVRAEIDEAPTRQEPQMRIATPAAAPLYVETIASARSSAAMRAAQPIAPPLQPAPIVPVAPAFAPMVAPAPRVAPTPFPVASQAPLASTMPQIPPAPALPRALDVPPTPFMATPPPFAQLDVSRSADTIIPPARRKATIAIVAATVAAAFVLVIVAVVRSHDDKRALTIPTASASLVPSSNPATQPATTTTSAPTRPLPTAVATSQPAPVTTATAVAQQDTLASIPSTPSIAAAHSKAKHRFFVRSGRIALDEAGGASLADCKRPHGRFGAGEVRVTFFPSTGRVVHVQIGPPFAGTDQGRCIVGKFRQAQVDPFTGPPSAINYVFRMPR